MRKKTVTHVADTIFWYALYFFPIILTIIQSIGLFDTFTLADWAEINAEWSFYDFDFGRLLYQNLYALGFGATDIITVTLESIFGLEGILPFCDTSYFNGPIFMYFAYFVCVYLCHLVIDFILFIPRIAHKWLNKFTKECE